ncbi:MAG: MFS transporter permease [Gammaproteobacteria bacterium]|nr:MFS transporter permease [Gammaproteobacteria bacterium]
MAKVERTLADQIYGYLAEDEDARVCKDIPESACDEQPESFTYQLLALTLTKFGDALVSARLVLAWMLAALGSPAIFIALLVPLRESLALLPQLFVAQVMRERPVRKWFWVIGSIGQAVALAAMLPAVLTLDGFAAGATITGLLVVFSLSRGICSVAAKDVLGKTISKTRRGRLTGAAASAAGFITLLVAAVLLAGPYLESATGFVVPQDRRLFAMILGTSALLWFFAAAAYARIPEVPGATEGGGNAITEAIRSLSLLREDQQFRRFVIARALLVSSAFAIPYIVVLIQRAGNGSVTDLGALLLANGAAALLSGPLWGRWSDAGSERVMAAAAAISVAVMLATLAIHHFATELLGNAIVAGLVLFAAAVAHQGARVGRKTYLVDMATTETRAQYTAVSNTVIGIFLLAGAGLGVIDAWLGTTAVLWFLAAVGVIAVIRSLSLPRVSD